MIHSSFLQMIRVITNKEDLTTTQSVVVPAVSQEGTIMVEDLGMVVAKEYNTQSLVVNVAMRLLSHLNLAVIVQFIAVTVLGISVLRDFSSLIIIEYLPPPSYLS